MKMTLMRFRTSLRGRIFLRTVSLILLFLAGQVFGQTVYRIRLPHKDWSVKLEGVAGTRTEGESIIGTYDARYGAHEFLIERSGGYELYYDREGGTSWTHDDDWDDGSATGKMIIGSDFYSLPYFDDEGNFIIPPGSDDDGDIYLINASGDSSIISLDNIYGYTYIQHFKGKALMLAGWDTDRGDIIVGGNFYVVPSLNVGDSVFAVVTDSINNVAYIEMKADTVYFHSNSTNHNLLWKNFTDGVGGSYWRIYKLSETPADDDDIIQYQYYAHDELKNNTEVADLKYEIKDVTNGDEAGGVTWRIMMDAGLYEFISMSGYNGIVDEGYIEFNANKQDVDYIVNSSIKDDAFKVDGGTGKTTTSIADDDDFDNTEILSTGLEGSYGMLIVSESVDGVTGIYRLENQTIVAVSQNASMTTTKDNAGTYNIYWETDQYKVQNNVGDDKNVKVGFYGVW